MVADSNNLFTKSTSMKKLKFSKDLKTVTANNYSGKRIEKNGGRKMICKIYDTIAAHFPRAKRQQDLTPKNYLLKKLMTATFISLLLLAGEAEAQKMRNVFPIGSYHFDSVTVNGLSFGIITERDILNNTNGIKVEVFGSGGLLPFRSPLPIAGSALEYRERMDRSYLSRVNGVVVSGFGVDCDCVANGLSIGFFAQRNRKVNGVSAVGVMNYLELNNGIQVSGLGTVAYKSNGLQVSISNQSNITNGFQIGGYNSARQMRGIQIGFVNRSEKLKGLQIGLWNMNGRRKLPLINF